MTVPNRWEHQGSEADPWSAMNLIMSGVLFWGGVGWLVSRWLDSRVWMGVGVVVGGVLGVWCVYLRYGRDQSGPPATVGPVVLPGLSEVTTTTDTPNAASVLPTPSAPEAQLFESHLFESHLFESHLFDSHLFESIEEDTL